MDGGLSLVPFFGTAAVSVLSARAAKIAEGNSKRFAEEVKERVNRLDLSKLDKSFVESDEFASLLFEILTRNARAYEEEKIKLFANIFVHSAFLENSRTPYKEGFIRIVSDLSLDHIALFRCIYDKGKDFTEEDKANNCDHVKSGELLKLLEISVSRLLAYAQELMRFGVTYDWTTGRLGAEDSYGLTEYGREFALFLIDPDIDYSV